MSAQPGPRGEIADIARQARDLLGRVRDSRWPGFELTPAQAAPAAVPPRKPAPPRQAALSRQPTPGAARSPARQRTDNAAPEPVAAAKSAWSAPALSADGSSWSSLEQIAQAVASCTKCPLHATRKLAVPGEGNAKARLLFVGEAPGEDEDRQGRPFVGKAGKLLDQMIVAMGLTRSEVFIANTLKCRPPGNRDPLEHEVAACLPYLRAQIALIHPEIICSLGRHSTHALLSRQDALGKLRGHFFEYLGTPLLPTYHPSCLLRTPANKKHAWADLQLIMRRLGLPLPDQHQARENE